MEKRQMEFLFFTPHVWAKMDAAAQKDAVCIMAQMILRIAENDMREATDEHKPRSKNL